MDAVGRLTVLRVRQRRRLFTHIGAVHYSFHELCEYLFYLFPQVPYLGPGININNL